MTALGREQSGLLCSGHGSFAATIEQFAAESFTHVECYCPDVE
jgi:hypothetical protein